MVFIYALIFLYSILLDSDGHIKLTGEYSYVSIIIIMPLIHVLYAYQMQLWLTIMQFM